MTVILIIAILAGLILGIASYSVRKADRSRALADIEELKNALEEYRLKNGAYPALGGTFTNIDVGFTKLRGWITTNVGDHVRFTDPWGRGYWYTNLEVYAYILGSQGPDALLQNDDITNRKGER